MEDHRTLGELTEELAELVGFGAQIKRGVNRAKFENWLKRAQRHVFRKHAAVFRDHEVYVSLAAQQSSIPYIDAIDFRKPFEITVDRDNQGYFYPLHQGISAAMDSVYRERYPVWQENTEYPLGARVLPAIAASVFYEHVGYTIAGSSGAVKYVNEYDDTAVAATTGSLIGAGKTDTVTTAVGSGFPYGEARFGIEGIFYNSAQNDIVDVYALRDDQGVKGFKVGEEFPYEGMNVGGAFGGPTTFQRTFSKSDMGVAVASGTTHVKWSGTIVNANPSYNSGGQMDVFLFGRSGYGKSGSDAISTVSAGFFVSDGTCRWESSSLPANLVSSGFPTHYEFQSDRIKLWPYSDSAHTIKISGERKVSAFENPNDRTSIDADAVLYQAAVTAKAHYRQPDAEVYVQMLAEVIKFLREASHQGATYGAQDRRKHGKPLTATRPVNVGYP